MKYWVISDTHFGHSNIINYTGRPFRDLAHMDESLIRNWNERVKPNDIVYFLGDFCFNNTKGGKEGEGTINKYLYYKNKLNGDIIIIAGNHDKNNSTKTLTQSMILKYAGIEINLTHRPQHANFKVPLNLVGHIHEKWLYEKFKETIIINCSVEQWKYRPISLEEIIALYYRIRKNQNII